MKLTVLTFVFVVILVGCSRNNEGSAGRSSVAVADDLGKPQEYFSSRYGAPKAEKHVTEFAFSLPGYGNMIHLARNFAVQDFESDRLKTKVVYSESAPQALWVKYTLPTPWTQEQINAALQVYSSNWKLIPANPAMDLIMQNKAPHVYVSGTSVVAYKTMVNELIIYAPQLYLDLRGQVEEGERQKKAVPKF